MKSKSDIFGLILCMCVLLTFNLPTHFFFFSVLQNCQSVIDQGKQSKNPLSFTPLGVRSTTLGSIQLIGSESKERRKTEES